MLSLTHQAFSSLLSVSLFNYGGFFYDDFVSPDLPYLSQTKIPQCWFVHVRDNWLIYSILNEPISITRWFHGSYRRGSKQLKIWWLIQCWLLCGFYFFFVWKSIAMFIHNIYTVYIYIYQWEFQDPKMEVR